MTDGPSNAPIRAVGFGPWLTPCTSPIGSPDIACPWCSTAVTAETATCPSCNAILISDEEHDLPGVTAIDAAIARGEKRPVQRGRFLSWFGGESPEEP